MWAGFESTGWGETREGMNVEADERKGSLRGLLFSALFKHTKTPNANIDPLQSSRVRFETGQLVLERFQSRPVIVNRIHTYTHTNCYQWIANYCIFSGIRPLSGKCPPPSLTKELLVLEKVPDCGHLVDYRM